MKLKRIILDGFKSFANRTVIEISDGITAIVGPNGSGKSNILDGIRWLFGEQSLKSIRAEEKADVLFSGSERRNPAFRARVELVLDVDGKELIVHKELTRDGKVKYGIDGKSARLKDIKELFKGTGVGKDYYSIIAQGQVEKIVTSSGKELRKLFEEAAGIAYYREKKKETLSKLEVVRRNLERVGDIAFEMEKRMKSLYLKAKRAQRYVEYSERLENVKRLYHGNVIMRIKSQISETDDEIERTREKIRSLQRELVDLESDLVTIKGEMERMDRELESYTKMLSAYEERKRSLLEVERTYSKKLSDLENSLIESSTKLDSIKEEMENLKKRKEEIEIIHSSLQKEIEERSKKLEELERKYEELSRDLSQTEKEILKMEAEKKELERRLMRLEIEREKLIERIEEGKRRISSIDSQIDSKIRRKRELEYEIEMRREKYEELSKKERELLEEMEKVKTRKNEIRSERERLVSNMNEILRRKAEISAEISSLERQMEDYVGFSRAVREVFRFKDRFEGLHDVVANIVEMDEEHETAIGALLGGMIQNVVVEDSQVAKEIIEFLKEIEGGRITLLPLDLIEGRTERIPGLERHPGFIGYAVDLVRVPKGFEKLTKYLFGSDVVVRTIDDAIDIKKRFRIRGRIATLEGDLIGTRGAITGGSKREMDSLLNRKTRLKKLKEELNFIEEELKRLDESLKLFEKELSDLDRHSDVLKSELMELSAKSESVKRFIQETVIAMDEMTKEIENLEKLRKDYEAKIRGMEERLSRIDDEEMDLKEKISKIEKDMKDRGDVILEKKEELSKLSQEIHSLRAHMNSLSEKLEAYGSELETIREKMERFRSERDELSKRVERLEREIVEVKELLIENEREMKSLEKEYEKLFESMKLHHEGKEEKIRRLKELEDEIENLKNERDELREYLHRLEMRRSNLQMELERHVEIVGDIEVELVSDEELSNLKKEIEDLESKLKHIGPVDLGAIDEYDQVEREYQDLMKQRKDLEEAERKLLDIMKQTEQEAKRKFMEVFEKVNENFSDLMNFLFFGGEGRIRMLSEDVFESDLEIVVKKPGKRIQKLQLLSGGEKALVAIALLFSFLKVNPSPFYVLDEVDAPLDDYNAERFASLLKESSKDSQFILITHNKIVMESADLLNGITMIDGVSTVIPVKISEIEEVIQAETRGNT